MSRLLLALAATAVAHAAAPAGSVFYEGFDSKTLGSFVLSSSSDYFGQPVEVAEAKANAGTPEADYGLVLTREAKRYAITAPLPAPISTADDKPLVVQYEVRLQDGQTCGGSYIKLYEAGVVAATVTPNSPYTIMFGPDKCGATDKVHFIIRWRNPVTGDTEEKHLMNPPRTKADKLSHVYTLILRPDATYAIKIDEEVEKEGSLSTDFAPSILPSKEIDDPTDIKPADWVDAAQIADPSASKPEDWDEDAPQFIPDAEAVKPEDWLEEEPAYVADPAASKPEFWDDEEDGDWVAPQIANPKCEVASGCGKWERPMKANPAYKGKWQAPMIPNPAYKGPWMPRRIANPAYFEDEHLNRLGGKTINAIGVEVWTMSGGVMFDNFLVTRDEEAAAAFAESSWRAKHAEQDRVTRAEEKEAERKAREEAAENGGVLEKVAFAVSEVVDMALERPVAAIVTVLVLVVSLLSSCLFCCTASSKDVLEAEAAAAAAAAAAEGEGEGSEATGAAEPAADSDGAAATEAATEQEEAAPTSASKEGARRRNKPRL